MGQPNFAPPADEYIDSLLLKIAASKRLSGKDLDTLIFYIHALRRGARS